MNTKKNTRVLIVEDDHLISEFIKALLNHAGYIIAGEASDGKEAVSMVETCNPDVILMDIQMPVMNGIEATKQIFETHPTPVVALTAYESQDFVHQASEAGIGAYLLKPPEINEIERAIVIAVARFNDMLELRRLNADLKKALEKVKTLSGMLPICAHCKKIRDDQGYWNQVEVYIKNHSDVEFTHGICPDCISKFFPEIEGKSNE
ncbi:MAG: response regulator [Spirochaetales bacterium]|nr:response regulator [Spirochaetales bacterium]